MYSVVHCLIMLCILVICFSVIADTANLALVILQLLQNNPERERRWKDNTERETDRKKMMKKK